MTQAAFESTSSVNTHYLHRVTDLAGQRHVAAMEDIFEAIVATRAIQWRLRGRARDPAPHSAAQDGADAESFQPLIAMLDAEPDPQNPATPIAERPRQDASGNVATQDERTPAGPVPRTLLLVDDEPNVISALVRLLRQCRFRILTAPSAEVALAILAHNDVGVILSDHRMPGMSGVELLSQVKTLYPATVRLILSGYADSGTVTDAIRLGAIYKFLTKPWNSDELGGILLGAFDRYERGLVGMATASAVAASVWREEPLQSEVADWPA